MLTKVVLTLAITMSSTLGEVFPVLAQPASSVTEADQIIVRVDGASCPFCAFGLEKRLGRLDGVAHVRIEMKAGEAIVTVKKGATVSEQALRQAVEEAGFTPREIIYPTKPGGPQ